MKFEVLRESIEDRNGKREGWYLWMNIIHLFHNENFSFLVGGVLWRSLDPLMVVRSLFDVRTYPPNEKWYSLGPFTLIIYKQLQDEAEVDCE